MISSSRDRSAWQTRVGSCPLAIARLAVVHVAIVLIPLSLQASDCQTVLYNDFKMPRFDFQSMIFWGLCKIWLFLDFPNFLSGNTDGTLRRVCSSTFICAFCRQTFRCFRTRLPDCAREGSTNLCRQLSSTCAWPHIVARHSSWSILGGMEKGVHVKWSIVTHNFYFRSN